MSKKYARFQMESARRRATIKVNAKLFGVKLTAKKYGISRQRVYQIIRNA